MIYTFYSFKGGVGRSMALANVAECFYLRGLRVVMIDWDLEAPGLESFFAAPVDDAAQRTAPRDDPTVIRARSRLGLVDMLESYKGLYPTLSSMDTGTDAAAFSELLDETLPKVHEFLYPIHPPAEGESRGAGLWLLTAGWRAGDRFPSYARAVQGFDWSGFYTGYNGEIYFNWLRDALKGFADVVLIDSRTGVTEMGGVCARQMADAVVALCAPNDQNMDGVSTMVESFVADEIAKARGGRWPDVIVVPTRIDASEEKRLERFRLEFHERVRVLDGSGRLPKVFDRKDERFWGLQIPYIPYYSYKEQRVIGPGVAPDANRRLESAYRQLATYLAVLAPEDTSVRGRFAEEIARELPALRARVTMLCSPDDPTGIVAATRAAFAANHVSLWPDIDADDPLVDRPSVVRCLERTESLVVPATRTALASQRVKETVREARRQGRCVYLVHDGSLELARLPRWAQAHATQLDARRPGPMVSAVTAPCPGIRVPMMAPARPIQYIERRETAAALRNLLLPSASRDDVAESPPARIVIVVGLPGCGKAALVSALCDTDEIADEFVDGILWLKLGTAPDPAALRLELYRALLAPGATPPPTAVKGELERQLRDRRVLLVLDDAHEAATVREFADLVPSGVTVVTTRDASALAAAETSGRLELRDEAPSLGQRGSAARARVEWPIVMVGSMSDEEAVAQLEGSIGQAPGAAPISRAMLAELAKELANLPLALALASVRLRERARSGADVEAEIGAVTRALAARTFDQIDPAWQHTVLTPVARKIGETLATIPREDRRRLEQWAGRSQAAASAEDLAAIWGVTTREVDAVGARLASRALVTTDEHRRYVLHPLVWAVLIAPTSRAVAGAVGATPRPSGSALRKDNPDVALANRVLAGQVLPATELRDLAKRLRSKRIFDLARRVLALARTQADARSDPSLLTLLTQQQALCTYKDRDLDADRRFDWALQLLGELGPIEASTNPETLGLAGAVHKNRWLLDGQTRHLELSLAAYRRGFAQGIDRDYGYTAINAAFVDDLLAWEATHGANGGGRPASPSSESAHVREARGIREQVAARLPQLLEDDQSGIGGQWWFCATVAEACFGLGRYDDALAWIRRGQASPVDPWEYESTARQLAWLARIQHHADTDSTAARAAQHVLGTMIGGNPTALAGLFLGKVGLALSGGGFRASLFHIGVLARLADLDLLRHVEVLSCVSGGSIIGAHYYLKVRELLERKGDSEIRREDYQHLVAGVIDEFLAGVQENIRLRVMASPWAALRMALSTDYTRTDRLGELYERHLFARVPDDEGSKPRFISDLRITPKDEWDTFTPDCDNWRRAAKVPCLILNATSLNTAHNWQFTATWMGEPPDLLTTEIDANPRLARMYYWEAPKRYQAVRLGAAVAASSCVPALFEPLGLPGLYPERKVQLVDGGVHDNQGLSALVEAQCVVTLVSDASGQTSDVLNPGTGMLGVMMRSNNILQARVREASLRDLLARVRGGLVRGLMFLHLKRDLAADPVGHTGRLEQPEAPGASTGVRGALTSYGILREVQKRLAAIRTDLDAFSDAEAFALMLSGYRMAQADVPSAFRGLPGATLTEAQAGSWRFFAIEPAATGAAGSGRAVERLQKVLDVGGSIAFKVWSLQRGLAIVTGVALVTLTAGAAFALPYLLATLGLSWWRPVLWVAGGVAAVVVALVVMLRARGSCKSLSQIVLGLALAAGGWLIVWLHLAQLDGWYLRAGRLDEAPVPTVARPKLSWMALARWPGLGVLMLGAATLLGGLLFTWGLQQYEAARLVAEASRLRSTGRYREAGILYQTVLAANPRQADAAVGLARVHLLNGNTKDAATLLAGVPARDAWTLADRGFARRAIGQFDGALTDYDGALADDPENADWLRGRALTLKLMGRRDDAIEAYGRALAVAPGHLQTYLDRADLLFGAGRWQAALQDYRSALALRPADPDILTAIATLEARVDRTGTVSGSTGSPGSTGPGTTPPGLASRLDVIVADTDQLYAVDALGPALRRIGLQLDLRASEVAATEFRYAVPDDREEALRVARLLQARCFPELVPRLVQDATVKPRQFRLALAKGAPVPGPVEFATGNCGGATGR